MAGPSRRKPGFEDFAKARAPVRFRNLMTSKNEAHMPAGFEHTIAERAMPMFGAEISQSQSLKRTGRIGGAVLQPQKQSGGLAKFFRRDKEFKGGKK